MAPPWWMDRRRFLAAAGGAALAWARGPRLQGQQPAGWFQPDVVAPRDLTLTAAPRTLDLGRGPVGPFWAINGQVPGPTLRARRGERVSITLRNRLDEPTILHWHGLDVPEAADGHPRLAIPPGAAYRYEFTVRDRAGTYWYHPHTHGRTAPQTYRGLAGLFIVTDDDESSLALPSGRHDVPLVLQDKRLSRTGAPVYAPFGPDLMLGYLGDAPFANGRPAPVLEVDRAPYRLRLLNGSNARLLAVELTPRRGMTLIGTDGGLLDTPHDLDRLLLGTGERADVLVDFTRVTPGSRITLRSGPFRVPGLMMPMGRRRGRGGGVAGQGAAMDFVTFVVRDTEPAPPGALPRRLASLPPVPGDAGLPRREFRFTSQMRRHTINGRTFSLDRDDFEVPLGQTERWSLINESRLPHPVHVHAGQFRVRRRIGGRNRVEPWEAGLKDTVLLLPNERVDLVVRFAHHRGRYLMHCHNLEHEDSGMMLNFTVV